MPARSNEFQRLVFLVKQVLAPANATVTESRMLTDRETGDQREVDVCIETDISGHPVTLCIECRDHKRLADVAWVEQMLSKHQRLATSALVLASRSGFSKSARTLARIKGIDLLVYNRLTNDDVRKAVDLTEHLWVMTYDLNVTKVVGVVPAVGDLPNERIAFRGDNLLLDEERRQVDTIEHLVAWALRDRRIADEFRLSGEESHRFFVVEIGVPRLPTGGRLFVEKLQPRTLRQLDELIITGRCRVAKSRVAIQQGSLGPIRVAWGSTRLAERHAMVVALESEGLTPSLTLHLSQPTPTAPVTRDQVS